MLTDKMGMQPILPVTVPFKKIKGEGFRCYGDGNGDGVVRCEQTFTVKHTAEIMFSWSSWRVAIFAGRFK